MGGSKAFLFLGFLLSLILLIIASHVSARDLAQTSNADNKNVDATVNPNGVDEAKYGNGYGGYPGGGGGYNNGGRGGNNGGGGYNNGGYPGRGRGGGCYYGCCRRSNYGKGCARCCSYAGEAVVAETYRAQPHN